MHSASCTSNSEVGMQKKFHAKPRRFSGDRKIIVREDDGELRKFISNFLLSHC